ncbi:DsrE/DsrF/DrsH-like family protein [Actinomycetota bacterium]
MTDAPIIPDFGDDDADSGERKLVVICSKGDLDMAYPGLILASAALGEGIETHIFFTFWGFDIINKKTQDNLKFSLVGNTAMHMPELAKLRPGLENMSMPQVLGGVPGMTTAATKMMKKQIADLDIPTIPEMVEHIQDMGGHLWACRLSFDMMKLKEEDLVDGVEGVISATDFMELSEGAQIIFV